MPERMGFFLCPINLFKREKHHDQWFSDYTTHTRQNQYW